MARVGGSESPEEVVNAKNSIIGLISAVLFYSFSSSLDKLSDALC